MRRIAIIDHDSHELYIEDISDKDLEKYNDGEQAYIDDNYDLENYSWDYIVGTTYFPTKDDPVDINVSDLA